MPIRSAARPLSSAPTIRNCRTDGTRPRSGSVAGTALHRLGAATRAARRRGRLRAVPWSPHRRPRKTLRLRRGRRCEHEEHQRRHDRGSADARGTIAVAIMRFSWALLTEAGTWRPAQDQRRCPGWQAVPVAGRRSRLSQRGSSTATHPAASARKAESTAPCRDMKAQRSPGLNAAPPAGPRCSTVQRRRLTRQRPGHVAAAGAAEDSRTDQDTGDDLADHRHAGRSSRPGRRFARRPGSARERPST